MPVRTCPQRKRTETNADFFSQHCPSPSNETASERLQRLDERDRRIMGQLHEKRAVEPSIDGTDARSDLRVSACVGGVKYLVVACFFHQYYTLYSRRYRFSISRAEHSSFFEVDIEREVL